MNPREKFKELMEFSSENEILEFKIAKNNFELDKLGKYFSALSNEANLMNKKSAWMIFGIGDDKTVLGTNYAKGEEEINKLKYNISTQTTNNISFIEVSEIIENGKRILLFEKFQQLLEGFLPSGRDTFMLEMERV